MASGSARSSSIAYDRMGPLRAKPASLPASGIFFDSAQPSHLPRMPSMDSSVLDVSSSKNQLTSADDRQQVQTSISSSFFLPSGSLTRSSTNMHHTQYVQDVGFSGNQVENSEKMNRKVTVEKPEVNIKKNENVTYASDVADSIRSSVPVTPARLTHDSLLGLKRNHPEFLFGHFDGHLAVPRSFILQKAIAELVSVFGDDFTSWFTAEKQKRLGIRVMSSVENSVSGSNDVTFYQNWPRNSTLLAHQDDRQNMTSSYSGMPSIEGPNGNNGEAFHKNQSVMSTQINHPGVIGESFIDASLDQDESVFFPAPDESFRPSGKSASSTPNQRTAQHTSLNRSVMKTGNFSLNGSALDAMRTLEIVAAAPVSSFNNDQPATAPHPSPQEQCDESHESAINKLLNLSDELNVNLTAAMKERSGVQRSDEANQQTEKGDEEVIVSHEQMRSFVLDRSLPNDDVHSETKNPDASFLFQLPLKIGSSNQTATQSPIYHFTGTASDEKSPLFEHQSRNEVLTGSDGKSFIESTVADQLEISFKKRRVSLPVFRQNSYGSTASSESCGVQSLPGCTSSAKKRSLHGDSINQNWSQGLQTIVMKTSASDLAKSSSPLKFFPENVEAENFVPKRITTEPIKDVQSSMAKTDQVKAAASFIPVSLMECLTGGSPASSPNKPIISRLFCNTLTTQSQRDALVEQYIPRPDNPLHLTSYHMRKCRFLDLIGRGRMSPNQALHHLGPMLYHVSSRNGSPVVTGQTIPLRTAGAPPTMIINSLGLQRVLL